MSLQAAAALSSGRESASRAESQRHVLLRLTAFGCGLSSAFGIDLMGELFWAELLLPLLGIGMVLANPPRELFADRTFRVLMLGIIAMFLGYVLSDIAAGTPREMYLRGWARVAVLGTSAFSLCVLSHRDRRSLWWFCVGMGIGGFVANALTGMSVSQWKLGYGEPAAYLAAASGALLSMSMASAVVALIGSLTILLDYRSLGALMMITAAATFLRSRNIGLDRLRKNIPLLVLGFGLVASTTLYLLNTSQDGNVSRREVSNISRFAALRIGARAIVDSPLVGYGSWGQGTQKYADMLYDETIGDLLSIGAESVVGDPTRGRYFSAHSQIVQAWMEGGILAGGFFISYIILLVKAMYLLTFKRPADYITPLALLIVGSNLWAAVMSPFLGYQRVTVALTIAAIVMLSVERRTIPGNDVVNGRTHSVTRPVNLMP